MFKFEKSIMINRPQQEVFDFVTDLANDSKWQTGIVSVERTSEGPIGAGSTWRYKLKFMGREMEAEIELTSYDPPNQASVKSIGGGLGGIESLSAFGSASASGVIVASKESSAFACKSAGTTLGYSWTSPRIL